MINIGPLLPPASTPKVGKTTSRDVASAGTEVNKDAQYVELPLPQTKKRRGRDRRKKKMKPLMDLRISADRREDADIPSIDIKI